MFRPLPLTPLTLTPTPDPWPYLLALTADRVPFLSSVHPAEEEPSGHHPEAEPVQGPEPRPAEGPQRLPRTGAGQTTRCPLSRRDRREMFP